MRRLLAAAAAAASAPASAAIAPVPPPGLCGAIRRGRQSLQRVLRRAEQLI